MPYVNLNVRYTRGRQSHLVALIWSQDGRYRYQSGIAMTLVSAIPNNIWGTGALTSVEKVTFDGTGTGRYVMSTWPALPPGNYDIEFYDVDIPSATSPASTDNAILGMRPSSVYWDGTNLWTGGGISVGVGHPAELQLGALLIPPGPPVIVATDSTLSITRSDIKRALGLFLTISRDPNSWSPDTVGDMNGIIKGGENGFYHPLPLPGEHYVHIWSFLEPILEQPILAGVKDYTLPADFSGFPDPFLSFEVADNQLFPVQLTTVGEILRLRQTEGLATYSQPVFAAETWITGDQTHGQRKKLMVFPSPTVPGTLTGRYHSNPNAISDATPYPLGGQPHSQTLLESVLSVAEQTYNDERGIHTQRFLELMAASIAFDRQRGKPSQLGFNRFRGSGNRRSSFQAWERHPMPVVTYSP